MNTYFMIDSSDESWTSVQFDNLRTLFRSVGTEVDILINSLKRKSFDQRKYFDLYDKILSPIQYLTYTNDERTLLEETY